LLKYLNITVIEEKLRHIINQFLSKLLPQLGSPIPIPIPAPLLLSLSDYLKRGRAKPKSCPLLISIPTTPTAEVNVIFY
jgi:hypothetical protein